MKFVLLAVLSGAVTLSAAGGNIESYAKKYWSVWHKNKPVARKSVKERAAADMEYFVQCVKNFAPHWLDEFAAIDRAFGWEKGTYQEIALRGIDYKTTPPPHECTSWVVMPEFTGGKVMLHKNRDAKSRYLMAVRREVPGKYAWTGIADFGSSGVNSGMNCHGLAVVMNNGDKTWENRSSGFGTTQIARILLENCRNADEAVALLQKIIAEGAYTHGKSGSIWFIADAQTAYVAENTAKRIAVQKITSGFCVRANMWHLPELLPYSCQTPKGNAGNSYREYAVRKTLFQDVFQKGRVITQTDVARAARIYEIPEAKNVYPLCGKMTIAASTFVIDNEFPADLSYASYTFGPPAYTYFVPVPLTLKTLPEELLNGTYFGKAFKLFDAKAERNYDALQKMEAQIEVIRADAENRARTVLRRGGQDAKAQAAAILETAFRKIWELVK